MKTIYDKDMPFSYLHTGPATPDDVPPRPDQGEVLVLIHGARGAANIWKDQLPPFAEVGNSMGGAVALDFTLTYPDGVKGLVLIGTGARLRAAPQRLEHLQQAMEGKASLVGDRSAFSPRTSDEVVRAVEVESSTLNI